jgi:DNA-binding beta-propeller fold protein YncE
VAATWSPGCGTEGPRGLAIDAARGLLFAACTDGAVTLKGGVVTGRLKTGAGVDNIDYDPYHGVLYIAAGKDGMLTRAQVADSGTLTRIDTIGTAPGARTVVVDGRGSAFVADSPGGRLLVFRPGFRSGP